MDRTCSGVIRAASALAAATGCGLAGCTSPLARRADEELQKSVIDSVRRELAAAEQSPGMVQLTREPRVASLGLSPKIMAELEQTTGPASYAHVAAPLGKPLLGGEGGEQRVVSVTLERAIKTAVQNNLNVQFARLAPVIKMDQLVAAQAAFDWVFFTNFQWTDQDQPRSSPSINGATVGVTSDQRQIVDTTLGLRRKLETGGQVTVQHQFTYTDVETPNLFTVPNPARDTNITVQLDQPLLRGAGSDVALAQVRIARNAERDEVQALKANLLKTVTDVESAYWALVRAQTDVKILQRLLEGGEKVRDTLESRGLDVKPSQVSDSKARVQRRSANVTQAQQVLAKASDRLKVLINDPELTIGSDILVLPADTGIDEPISYSLRDSIRTALSNRPEVQRALLSIDDTSIRQQVADNARLPQLNLRAQTRFSSQGDSTGSSYNNLTSGNFIDYLAGLSFEQPLGNREAEATYRQRRIERMQGVVAYWNTIQGIVQEVITALRDVTTNYVLIEQRRAARVAAAENLRTLLVEQQTIGSLTPEFLDRKFNRQEALAAAEQDEIQALTDYNESLSRLYAATGTALERSKIIFEVDPVVNLNLRGPLFPEWPEKRTSRAVVSGGFVGGAGDQTAESTAPSSSAAPPPRPEPRIRPDSAPSEPRSPEPATPARPPP